MLDFKIMFRKGSQDGDCIVHESYSCDFTIDGASLLDMIVNMAGGHKDFLGCFARGWDNLNQHSLKQLLLKDVPETESGRRLEGCLGGCLGSWMFGVRSRMFGVRSKIE